MTDTRSDHRRFDWQDYLPWLLLFRALRPAISFRLLALSALGLVGTIAGWRMIWNLLVARSASPDGSGGGIPSDPVLAKVASVLPEGAAWPPWPWEMGVARAADQGALGTLGEGTILAPMIEPLSQLTVPFQMLFSEGLGWNGLAYVLLCSLWALALWALIGGMITRTAVMKLARGEPVGWKRVRSFAQVRWSSYFTAPLFPLVGVFFAAIPVAILGLIARSDFGAVITGILWPLALLAGFVMALLLVGLSFGWPLMWSTISAEGTDAFDALSRSYAYVFQRPIHLLFYGLLAAVAGSVGYAFVSFFGEWVLHCAVWAASWGGSPSRMLMLTHGGVGAESVPFGAHLIGGWNNAIRTVIVAFPVSYLWCSTSAIYLLLRRQVDSVEMDEVFLDEEEEFGMPTLETDAAGVPGVSDDPINGQDASGADASGDA